MTLAPPPSFAVVLLLSIAVGAVYGADSGPPSQKADDPLETARRELQELPTLERSARPEGRMSDPALALPAFRPSTPGSPSPQAKQNDLSPTTEPMPSQGWLLDALRKTEVEDRARTKARTSDDRLSPEAMKRKLEGAPNPLNNYLQQWLSPGDRRLLGGEKLSPTQLERAGIREDEPFRPKNTPDAHSLLSNPKTHLPLSGERVNPYLTPSGPEERLLTEPLAPLPATAATRTPLSRLSSAAPDQSMYSPPWDTTPTVTGSTAKPAAIPPPTTPLLDERRYFPQLRRF